MTRLARTFARLMLRSANTPLSAVWALAYWSVVRSAVARLRRQYRGASIYVKGSFASREQVYGISDVDLVVVLPPAGHPLGSDQLSARERWKQLLRRFPLLGFVIGHSWFYDEDDLRKSLSAPCLTYGLASNYDTESDADRLDHADRAAFLGSHPVHDHMGLQTHASLYGARNEWRHLAGTDRLPRVSPHDPQSRRLTAWMDLQYWWRYAFQACADPTREHIPLLCVKLLAEPVRLWLWVERNEQVPTREAALQRGLSELPEEREAFQLGLNLLRSLHNAPSAPVPEVIAALLRHTERLAQHMTAAADAAGYVDVRLVAGEELVVAPEVLNRRHERRTGGGSGELLPLADWRARAVPRVPDETFMLIQAAVPDVAFLAATARADDGHAIPACRYNSMLLLPTTDFERGVLRAVQCQPTDPVSMALADGHTIARFPELAGWSALHCARRAVAEHRAWLAAAGDWAFPPHGWVDVQSTPQKPTTRTLGLLFTAARAALFHESCVQRDPELAVNVAGVADALVARDSSCSDVVYSALHDFRASRAGASNDPMWVAAMLEVVGNLPEYAASASLTPAAR